MVEAISVQCPSCETDFPVDPAKVPAGGVNARCSECSDIFRVEEPDAVRESTGPAADAAAEPTAPTDESSEEPGPTGEAVAAEPGGEQLDTVDFYFGGGGEGEAGRDGEDEESGVGLEEPSAGEPATGSAAGTGDTATAPPAEEAAGTATPGEDTDAPPAHTPDTTPGQVEDETAGPDADAPAAPRPSFGQRSPEEKAQRLARVLVSDMITYNPQLYETALERGTLKEDFEEEIEKSWEEYVAQVGEDLANSTSYWKDALNDILAKGDEVF